MVVGPLEVVGQPFDLSSRQRRQPPPHREELTVALRRAEATGSIDRTPEGPVLATLGPKPKLLRPLQGIDVEAGWGGLHPRCEPTEQER